MLEFFVSFFKTSFFTSQKLTVCTKKRRLKQRFYTRACPEASYEASFNGKKVVKRNLALLEHCEKTMVCQKRRFIS